MSRGPFQIVLLAPPGYAHVAAFREIAETLHHGLRRLGEDAPIVLNRIDPGRRPIVLGANLLPYLPQAPWLPPETIVYNLEQLIDGSHLVNDALLAALRRHEVWDYSERNIAWLAQRGIAARRLPIAYAPELSRIAPADEQDKDIDVLFYGSLNPRREAVLNALRAAGATVAALFGVYGAERDALIARSRLVLNVHRNDARVFELVRVSYLLANGCAVVAEGDAETELAADLREGLALAPYDGLVERCLALLRDEAGRAALGRRGFAAMRRRDAAALLKPLLAAPAGSPPAPVWHSLSHSDPAVTPYHQIARQQLVDLIDRPPRLMLDVGCGAGASSALVKSRFPAARAWGIEPHRGAAAQAAGRLDRVFTGLLEEVDFARAGLAPGAIDTVLLADVLEHMVDPWDALRRLRPWLAADARLLVSLPNARNLGLLNRMAEGRFQYEAMGILDVTHLRFFALADARRMVEETGYKVRSVHHALDPSLAEAYGRCNGRAPLDIGFGRLTVRANDNGEINEFFSLQHYLVLEPA